MHIHTTPREMNAKMQMLQGEVDLSGDTNIPPPPWYHPSTESLPANVTTKRRRILAHALLPFPNVLYGLPPDNQLGCRTHPIGSSVPKGR